MNIDVKAQNFSVTPTIDAHVRECLLRALGRLDANIVAVHVTLGDVNGRRGGVDKQAFVRISLKNGRVLPVEAIHSNLYVAVHYAARRSRRSVKRALNKQRQIAKCALRKLRGLPASAPQPA